MTTRSHVRRKTLTHRTRLACVAALIVLQACGSRPAPAPVVELNNRNIDDRAGRQAGQQKSYTVQPGDTLFSIAWYTGHDYRDLARFNNIAKPYRIYPGQELSLKKPATQTQTKAARNTGQTSKLNTNQPVDRSEKQAYGEKQQPVNTRKGRADTAGSGDRIRRWLWPAEGALTSRFSLQTSGNKGIEISGQRGSAVIASADGKVVYTGSALRGYGQLIIIKHSDAFLSAYAHNERILVKEQQMVKAGQTIATMGNSGTDTVKLRFEVRYKGKSVDPLRYLPRQ